MKRSMSLFIVIVTLFCVSFTASAQQETVLDAINSRPELATLATAVIAANLTDTLSDPNLAITLFAPVNSAFDFAGEDLDALLADPAALQSLLFNHAVGDRIMAADLAGSVPTLSDTMQGGSLTTLTTGVGKVMIEGAYVVEADIVAGNSVIHLIDSVLVPVELQDVVTSNQTTVAQNRELGRMFLQEIVGASTPEEREATANLIVAEDYIQNNPLVGQGRQGLLDFLPGLGLAFSDLNITLDDVMAETDRVSLRWTISGTHTGPFLGYEPTGNNFSFSIIDIWVVEDGVFVEHWDEIGWLFFLLQIGVTDFPPPALAQ